MNIYSEVLIISAFISIVCSLLGFRRKHNKEAVYFSYLMLSSVLYSFGYAFQLDTKSISEILFWTKIQYLGIPFIPFFWILFALHFAGYERWITFKRTTAFLLIPAVTIILVFTMDKHSLFYVSFNTYQDIPLGIINIQRGIWYWFFQIYAYSLILMGIIVFISMYLKSPKPYRRQASTALIGSSIPMLAYTVYLAGLSPYSIDLIPFAISISGVFYFYALANTEFLKLIPISRDKVFENMMGSVFVFDRNNNLVDYNPRAKSNFGFLNEEMIGKHVRDMFSDNENITENIVHLDRGKSGYIGNISFGEKTFSASFSHVTDNKGKTTGKLLILNDITEMVAIENKLRKNSEDLKNSIADKDKFFSIIAHDLRGPFQGFLGLSGILAEEAFVLSREEIKDFAGELNKSLVTQYNFLEELLQWAKLNTNRVSLNIVGFNLVKAINSVIDVLQNNASSKNISINLIGGEEVVLSADCDMIKLVIRNLLSNAIKFSYQGGAISVFAGKNENGILVMVTDEGVGIQAERIPKLFGAGTNITTEGTAKERGSGLGLVLCKEIIEKHKGKIWAESEYGKGSKFAFLIPN